ncbi:hypothetical protein [Candidatus Palauibacter sp.]|uniref:hypothetical protein n=1 Tax=Candidatus Palauibacter sp. TaxID=3101350 RepID=UPI003B0213A5
MSLNRCRALQALRVLMAGVFVTPDAVSGAAVQLPGSSGACEARSAETRAAGAAGALTDTPTGRAAADLHCISLFSTARAGDAQGFVELGRVPSPFGVSVTPSGHHVRALTAHIEGLPPPGSLGPYTVYVAWATPLELAPVVPLGPVGNGEHRLGRVAFNKFLVMVSAEASADVRTREGPLVLRGRSPSALMEAHDLLALAPSATRRARRHQAHRGVLLRCPLPGRCPAAGRFDVGPAARQESRASPCTLWRWLSERHGRSLRPRLHGVDTAQCR